MVAKKAMIGKLFGDRPRRRRAMKGETNRDKLTGYVIGLEWAVAVAGGIVVLGLLVEDGPELWQSIATWTRPARVTTGGLLVTAGVFSEVLFAFLAGQVARRIDAIADADTAEIRREAAAANERASQNEIEAARLHKEAEEERLARVKLEQRIGGWKLNPEVEKQLIDDLKPFANTPFTLSANPSEASFMDVLYRLLISAGWTWTEPHVRPKGGAQAIVPLIHGKSAMNNIDGGVTLQMANEELPEWGNAAKGLAEGLMNKAHIPVEWKVFPREKLEMSVIDVVIGRRNE
jgi:hypothetical protein